MYYVRDPHPLAEKTEMAMYYEVVHFVAHGIGVCHHPVTLSGLIKQGFEDITEAVGLAGGIDEYVRRQTGTKLDEDQPDEMAEPEGDAPVDEESLPGPDLPGEDTRTDEEIEGDRERDKRDPLSTLNMRRWTKAQLVEYVERNGLEIDTSLPNFKLIKAIREKVGK